MPLFKTHDHRAETSDTPTDRDLVDRLRSGDELALNEIMRRYKERVYRFSWKYMGNEDAALDVTQETFTKLYFNIEKFDPTYKFSTWVFQIALNLCRDRLRKSKHMARDISFDLLHTHGAKGWEDSGENIETAFQAKQQLALLRKEIDLLPHNLKEAFVLFALEERPQSECAEILGVSVKTVETRVYRARRLLAEKIDDPAEG